MKTKRHVKEVHFSLQLGSLSDVIMQLNIDPLGERRCSLLRFHSTDHNSPGTQIDQSEAPHSH